VINSGATVRVTIRSTIELVLIVGLMDNETGHSIKRITPYPPQYVVKEGYFEFKTDTAGIYRFYISPNGELTAQVKEFSISVGGYRPEQPIDVAKGRYPTPSQTFVDRTNDPVLEVGALTPLGVNLAPVDIDEVDISNDGGNLIIQIKTAGIIPKTYWEGGGRSYSFRVTLKLDNDSDRRITIFLISEKYDWRLAAASLSAKDELSLRHEIDGNVVKINIPLSLEEIGGSIDEVSIRIRAAYEMTDPKKFFADYIPDQSRLEEIFINYKLWKD
jgi:hypothetical protein